MSYLPQISEEQRRANIRKLINQNKKLQSEIFVFEQQINKIVSNFTQEQRAKMEQSQAGRTSSRQRRSQSSFGNNTLPLKLEKPSGQQEKNAPTLIFDQQAIQRLLESNSPLIESKVIPSLKEHVEYLKSLNIKENMHYILKEEDDLKLVKKQMNRLRKQKQVVTDFIKDKTVKLQKQNNQLTNHKNSLKQQLFQTIKLNRHSASSITQLQRQIRKYHLMLHEYKRLSQPTIPQSKDKALIEKIKTNPSAYQQEIDKQYLQLKLQIATIEAKWKEQLDALDNEYYQLREEMAKKEIEEKTVKEKEVFHKTRILVMKDQGHILSQKQKQSLVKASPRLQKQLQEYLKEQQQKLRKKQQYLRKHRPRDKDEQQYQKIVITSAAKSPNPQNTIVETSHDDKNIVKLKSYLRPKEKVDKQAQAKIKKNPENQRLERNWSQTQEELSLAAKNSQLNLNKKDKEKKEKAMPRILLRSVKMGTTFHNSSEEDNH